MDILKKSVEQVDNSMKCLEHSELDVEFLVLSPSDEQSYLQCALCFNDNYYNHPRSIPLNLLRIMNHETILRNFPIEDNYQSDIFARLKDYSKDARKNEIDMFFKDFRSSFLDKIQSIQDDMINRIQKIVDMRETIFSSYNKVIKKKDLQDILADSEKTIEEKNNAFKVILEEIEQNKTEISGSITQKLDYFSQLDHGINFSKDFLTEMKVNLQNWISEIQHVIEQNGKEDVEDSIPDKELNFQNFINFIQNFTNDMEESSYQNLYDDLAQMQFAFTFVRIPEPGKTLQNILSIKNDYDQTILKSVLAQKNKPEALFQNFLNNPNNTWVTNGLQFPYKGIDLKFSQENLNNSIKKTDEGILIQNSDSISSLVFSNALKNLPYLIRLIIEKPKNEEDSSIQIGFVQDKEEEQPIEQICYTYPAPNSRILNFRGQQLFEQILANQNGNVKKGREIMQQFPQSGTITLDLQFRIQQKSIYLSNYPYYSDVNEIHFSSFYNTISQYKLAILMKNSWKVTIAKCSIIHPSKVSEFTPIIQPIS